MHATPCNISLPAYATHAIDVLERAGYEAWCVGGCVRDALLGRDVNDYDIATNALWPQTKEAFEQAGYRTHETTGIKHGTLTVIVDEQALEVTTYRSDGKYSDARHPDNVQFVRTIEEDLARRDFTMNALAYHPERGLLDCHGGLADVEEGIIRVVGDGSERFAEDALRILRACRFASQLGFSIEPATFQAMMANKVKMGYVSAERITAELQAFLLGPFVHDALLETVDVLAAILPELVACKGFDQNTPYHIYDVLEHTAYVIANTDFQPLVRWAALLHDLGKPGACFHEGDVCHFYGHANLSVFLAKGILDRLCLSPSFKDDVLTLVRIHDDKIQPTARSVKRALARLDGRVDLFRALCNLKKADAQAQAPLCAPRIELAQQLEDVLDEILAADEAFTLKKLAINGNDVVAAGVAAGPRVGEILGEALDAVIDETVPNDRDALLAFVRERI